MTYRIYLKICTNVISTQDILRKELGGSNPTLFYSPPIPHLLENFNSGEEHEHPPPFPHASSRDKTFSTIIISYQIYASFNNFDS